MQLSTDSDVDDDDDDDDDIEADVRKMKQMRMMKPAPTTDTDSDVPGPSEVKSQSDPVKAKQVKSESEIVGKEKGSGHKTVPGKSKAMSQGQKANDPERKEETSGKKVTAKKVVSVKKEAGTSDSEETVKARPRKKALSVDSAPSGSGQRKAQIDVYLNDSKRSVEQSHEQKEEKKRFKTFEEAFMHSISETLGPRNASKRNYDQLSGHTTRADISRKQTKRARSVSLQSEEKKPQEESESSDGIKEGEKTIKIEADGDSEKNLSEDIEVLKHETDKFLEKYKKDKPPDKEGDSVICVKSEQCDTVPEVSEHSYVCKKKVAAQNANEQIGMECLNESNTRFVKSNVPDDLVEKHKDLGQELIQLTHDIIQQQTTKSHKYLDDRMKGPLSFSSDQAAFNKSCATRVDQAKFGRPVFGETVSGQVMRSMCSQPNPMFVKEFGSVSSAASKCLDFSQLASQAKQIEKTRTEKPDMNLMCTIQKLSSSLQGQTQADSQQVLQLMPGSQGLQESAWPIQKVSDRVRKTQPAILRLPPSSKTATKSGMVTSTLPVAQSVSGKAQQKSSALSPKPKAVSPKQMQCVSPQATTVLRIQSPTGHQQTENPNITSAALNRSLLSPVSVSYSPSSVLHHTVSPPFTLQSSTSSMQPAVGTVNQPLIQGILNNSQGIQMISNVQKLSPMITTMNWNALQTFGQVLPSQQLLTTAQPQGTLTNVQTRPLLGSPTMLLQPQTVHQLPGRIITHQLAGQNIAGPQIVTTGNQDVSNVQIPVTSGTYTAGQPEVQAQLNTKGNQTFLVNIPVMRPTTSACSGSGDLLATGNLVTAVSSQEKQNKGGQSSSAVMAMNKAILVSKANSYSGGCVTPLYIVTSDMDTCVSSSSVGSSDSQAALLCTKKSVSTTVKVKQENVSPKSDLVKKNLKKKISKAAGMQIKIEKEDHCSESVSTKGNEEISVKALLSSDDMSGLHCVSSLSQKSASLSPPPMLQSPSKTLQLIPQPIVPISQAFTSSTSIHTTSVPSQLFDGDSSEDVKPPILELEAPMLEMEAPILKLESDQDTVSIKSDPDTLSNYSVCSNSFNSTSSVKQEEDHLPIYPMSSNDIEPAQTIVQTSSYNTFIGNKQPNTKKRRRKSGPDIRHNVVAVKRDCHSDEDSSSKTVSYS